MMRRMVELGRDLGPMGIAAGALLAAALLAQAAVVGPLEAKREALALEKGSRAGAPGRAGTGEKVAAVYAFLRKDEQPTDWLAKLHGIGTASGVQMKSATYRSQHTEGRIERYEIVLPVSGSYPQIRDFLRRTLEEIPVLSVDQLTLKRESRSAATVQAELRITLHMVKA